MKIRIIILFGLLANIICFTSCNVVNRHKTVTKTESDSISVHKQDSGSIHKNDSTAIHKKDSSATKSTTKIETKDIEVEFYEEDTCCVFTEVVITTKGDSTIINAGGRKIKNAKAKSNNTNNQTDSSHTKTESNTNVLRYDSTAQSNSDSTNLKKKTTAKEIDKKSFRVSLWMVLGFVIVIGLIICLYWFFGPPKKKRKAAEELLLNQQNTT